MSSYKTRAVILKSYNLGESDKIIKLFSKDSGLISAVAKGARKIKSKFGGRLELFNFVDLELSTGRSLDIINQAEILKSFKNIPLDFNKFIFCQLISEIVLKTHFASTEASPVLFKLIYICFDEIDKFPAEEVYQFKKISIFFMAKFLKITGYAPLISSCCKCGTNFFKLYNDKDISHNNVIYFSITLGGIVCRNCLLYFQDLAEFKKILSIDEYNFFQFLFTLNFKDFLNLLVENEVVDNIYKLLANYIRYHVDSSIDIFSYIKKIQV